MYRILRYVNPIARLGNRHYSYIFPFIITFLTAVLMELYANNILRNPEDIGLAAIFVFIALILYFAFRDGKRGGIIATTITILYYLYIIHTRQYDGEQYMASIQANVVLAFLYYLLAGIVGWLKETIDSLIDREANERRRLQTIIQQLPVGVVITDSKGVVVQANKQLEKILGKKLPLGFVVGKDTITKTILENGKKVQPSGNVLAQTLSTGKPIVGREFIIERDDGKKKYVQVSASPVENREGQIIAASSIVVDITEQKELETRKDDFVNMASHELKTPITSMKLYLDVLMNIVNKYDDKRAQKTLTNIKNQTHRLQKLVEDLLDVSRLQTGKLTFTVEDFRLDLLAEESVELLRGTSKTQEMVLTIEDHLIVNGDKFRIYQVLTNLITNAIKYSGGKQPIHVSVYQQGYEAIVSVQDFGIGISKEQQDKIFDRLYQVTDATEKTFPGFGMGLYIAKEIVIRHRGKIWVESEKGKGSTFFFSLPLNRKKT